MCSEDFTDALKNVLVMMLNPSRMAVAGEIKSGHRHSISRTQVLKSQADPEHRNIRSSGLGPELVEITCIGGVVWAAGSRTNDDSVKIGKGRVLYSVRLAWILVDLDRYNMGVEQMAQESNNVR
jgi:hypothetical protein